MHATYSCRNATVTAVLALAVACTSSVDGSASPASGVGAAGTVELTGVVHTEFPSREHQTGTIAYAQSPPYGGPHAAEWADCTGTVYDQPIPNENAVHSLEHGAVWITHRPDLTDAELEALVELVEGRDYTMLSPYQHTEKVSVQSWGYQLKTDDVNDPRIRAFVDKYQRNPETTPEPGATCANPDFLDQHQ